MKRTYIFLLALSMFLMYSHLQAQFGVRDVPMVSQKAMVMQRIGLTDITITYHRPAIKGRKVWQGMVPYNQGKPFPWRAGANQNTTIQFSQDVTIEGQPLKAGIYGLHMIPSKEEWVVIFSNNSTSWGSFTYKQTEDALRVKVTPVNMNESREFLTYNFRNIQAGSAVCVLEWEKKRIPIKMSIDLQNALKLVEKQLSTQAGWRWVGWFEAARFCLQNNIAIQKGVYWASRSVYMNVNFSNALVRAQLMAKARKLNETDTKKQIPGLIEEVFNRYAAGWKAWDAAAQYMARQKNYKQALAWSQKSIDLQPNFYNHWARVGIYTQMGDKVAANKARKKAIKVGTKAQINQQGFGFVWSGRPQKAIEFFEIAVAKYPKDGDVRDNLGDVYARTGQKDKAIATLRKALTLKQSTASRNNSLKWLKKLGVDYKTEK